MLSCSGSPFVYYHTITPNLINPLCIDHTAILGGINLSRYCTWHHRSLMHCYHNTIPFHRATIPRYIIPSSLCCSSQEVQRHMLWQKWRDWSYANITIRCPIPHLHVVESPSQCMEAILAIFYTILTSYNRIPQVLAIEWVRTIFIAQHWSRTILTNVTNEYNGSALMKMIITVSYVYVTILIV